jgi:hypothetical protein
MQSLKKLLSRKFILAVGTLGVTLLEVHLGHFSSADWVELAKFIVPSLILGQAAQNALLGRGTGDAK